MFSTKTCRYFRQKRPLFHLNRKHGRVTIQFVACSEGGDTHRKTRLTPFRETHAMVRSSFRLRSIAAGFFVSRFAVTDAASAAGVPWRWKAIARQLSLSWTHSRHSKRVCPLRLCHAIIRGRRGKASKEGIGFHGALLLPSVGIVWFRKKVGVKAEGCPISCSHLPRPPHYTSAEIGAAKGCCSTLTNVICH